MYSLLLIYQTRQLSYSTRDSLVQLMLSKYEFITRSIDNINNLTQMAR